MTQSTAEAAGGSWQAVGACVSIALAFVGPLHYFGGPLPRNHPVTIRRRMSCVLLTCCLAWLPSALILHQQVCTSPLAVVWSGAQVPSVRGWSGGQCNLTGRCFWPCPFTRQPMCTAHVSPHVNPTIILRAATQWTNSQQYLSTWHCLTKSAVSTSCGERPSCSHSNGIRITSSKDLIVRSLRALPNLTYWPSKGRPCLSLGTQLLHSQSEFMPFQPVKRSHLLQTTSTPRSDICAWLTTGNSL